MAREVAGLCIYRVKQCCIKPGALFLKQNAIGFGSQLYYLLAL